MIKTKHQMTLIANQKADDDQDQASDDSDCQDAQVEDSPEDLNINLNIHVMSHHI